MAATANVPDPMEREREHPRLTSVKPCTIKDCEGPAKCLFKHPDEQGVLESWESFWLHRQAFLGNGGRMVRAVPVLSCGRDILDLKSSGQICECKHDDIQLLLVGPEFPGTFTVGSRMPLVCAAVAWHMAGGGSAQTDPDHGMLVEPDDLKLDSGASNHVVCEKTLLQGYESLVVSWYIHVADDYPLEVVGIGYIITKEFFIPNVYRVKGLKKNLISVSQLARDHGLFAGFHGEICEVLKRDGEKVGGGFMQANGLYKLSFLEVPEAEAGYEGA